MKMKLNFLSFYDWGLYNFFRARITFLDRILSGPLPPGTPTIRHLNLTGITLANYLVAESMDTNLNLLCLILPFISSLSLPSIRNDLDKVAGPLYRLLTFDLAIGPHPILRLRNHS